MTHKVHRVIVSLTDNTHKPSHNSKNTTTDGDIKLLDKTTLLLRSANLTEGGKVITSRYYEQLQFDAVGYESDKHIQNELNQLLEQMIKQRRHGCLLRLTPRRTHNIRLLTHLLISDLDRILIKQPYHLIAINVEYYDVRKFDMVNMLLSTSKRKSEGNKGSLQTTRELFQWLHNEYAMLRGRGTGDDHINVEFVLSDGIHKPHQVHLSIYQIFDCNERTDLKKFFHALAAGKRSKSTLLTDCIRESFDRKQPISTLVVCEMPLDKDSTREKHKFLQLAQLACTSIGVAQGETEIQYKALDSKTSLDSRSRYTSSSNHSIETAKYRHQPLLNAVSPLNLSHEDYSKLAAWYNRIDSKYAEVKINMERHYNVQYRQKFLELCKRLNSCRILHDKSGGDAHLVLLKNSVKDLAATTNYVEALKQFRQLEREVKRSQFSATLSPYMSIKNFELVNAEEALQQQEVANLKEHSDRI